MSPKSEDTAGALGQSIRTWGQSIRTWGRPSGWAFRPSPALAPATRAAGVGEVQGLTDLVLGEKRKLEG